MYNKSRSSESFIKSRVFAWILFSVFWNDIGLLIMLISYKALK